MSLGEVFPHFDDRQRPQYSRDSLIHSTATMLKIGFAWMAESQRVETSIHAVYGRQLLHGVSLENVVVCYFYARNMGANPPPEVRKLVVCPWYRRAAAKIRLPR